LNRRRRARWAGRLALVVLVAVACGSPDPVPTVIDPSDTPAPSPTGAPSPPAAPSPTPPPAHGHDGHIDPAGLRHDSRDLLYRTPGGAVPAGTSVRLRLRSYWNDLTAVRLRLFSQNLGAEQMLDMTLAAENVACYDAAADEAGLACDFWEATIDGGTADNLWYRFIASDGAVSAYYADDTPALDGGRGRATPVAVDNGYALMVHEPGFEAPAWPSGAVAYQIFPDRFRNGDPANDPQTGDIRYDDPVLSLTWDTLPEGFCRRYTGADAESCPWRFDDEPPSWSPNIEGPRGRDYMGGDLRGVIEQLDYLADLGVDTIYFNPIFAAGSNHRYDTRDYTQIDPYLGNREDFDELIAATRQLGMRVILDGVFNHTSSDSPFFDRYGHYDEVGACEGMDSPYREWFYMTTARGPCVGPNGPGTANYQSWFGFDTLPILLKIREPVQEHFLTAPDSITRRWLEAGAAGWRMDVSGDVSFPRDYWRIFRDVVRETDPEALTISETWQKDAALLRNLRGDRFDTTMNYRLRDAALGLLAPHQFDAKGFPDSGQSLSPSRFAERLLSIQEDYPAATHFTLMNLLDSHDTERILWTLTPGIENRAGRELDANNVAQGKARLRLASLIQFSVPGMPTIYYGDEVGLTGDDDPDDRRTFPWADLGGEPDMDLFEHYRSLSALRRDQPAMVDGDLRVLATDDVGGTVALARRTDAQAVVVLLNASPEERSLSVPTAGFVPEGTELSVAYSVNGAPETALTTGPEGLTVSLPALAGLVLVTTGGDLAAPEAPAEARVSDLGDGYVELAWRPSGEGIYNVYRSPLSGGGWVRINELPVAEPRYNDSGLDNGRVYHYVVTAIDAAGNESGYSNETSEIPRLSIETARLVEPATLSHTISAVTPTGPICGEAWVAGRTGPAGPLATLEGALGYGPVGSAPDAEGNAWTWVPATYSGPSGDSDRLCASLLPQALGEHDYVFRFTTSRGRYWLYADLDGEFERSADGRGRTGRLTVVPSDDTQPPAAPAGLEVLSASPAGVELAWQPPADADVAGYHVNRADSSDPAPTDLGRTSDTTFTDSDVIEGASYTYQVMAYDSSWNFSPPAEVTATAAARLVSVTFTVTVPSPSAEIADQVVHIAGTLSRFEGGHPDWNPSATQMEKVDDTHWTITLAGAEGTSIEYKYTLGSWEHVEKDGGCGERDNRRLVLAFGPDDGQLVEDSVPNWRNVAPCGD
jgi:glycosidase/fibronectin type 3 domain-containing protein